MVSSHVTSLYTHIPIIDTLNIIKYYVNTNDQFTRKMAIPQEKFLHLLNLAFITTWYTFNSQFFQQIDGIPIGVPASSTTAETYMQVHESTVDDVCSILKQTHLENSTIFMKILSLLWKRKVMEN